MPRQRMTLGAESRAKAVLEVPRGERQPAEIATELQIQPNLLRAWKTDFLENASMVLGRNRDEDQRVRLEAERRQKEACQRKIGQLTMQVDWLKKKSAELPGPDYETRLAPKPFKED